jgi:uncharacterized protein (TIGR03089 family)
MTTTIPQALASAVRRHPATPLLTWYDDASGDRTELSGATLDNWVSKTANMVVDGAGLDAGDTVAVLLPPHWQTAAVLLGSWSAGLVRVTEPQPVGALFATPDTVPAAVGWATSDRYATGLLPLAMPLRGLPAGYADYVIEVRNYGDHFTPVQPVAPDDRATAELSHLALHRIATQRAGELGLVAGDRVLVDARAYPDVVDWLLAPLVAGASIVLCGNLDPAKVESRAGSEKATVTLT